MTLAAARFRRPPYALDDLWREGRSAAEHMPSTGTGGRVFGRTPKMQPRVSTVHLGIVVWLPFGCDASVLALNAIR
jgi:hypothetical protein